MSSFHRLYQSLPKIRFSRLKTRDCDVRSHREIHLTIKTLSASFVSFYEKYNVNAFFGLYDSNTKTYYNYKKYTLNK